MTRARKPKGKSKKGRKPIPSAPQVRQIARQEIMRLAERKQFVYNSTQDISTTMTYVDICNPAQGDTSFTRQGDEIVTTSLEYDLLALRDATATLESYDPVRVLIIRWHPNNTDDTPSGGEVFRDVNYPFGPLSLIKADRAKFSVLFDKRVFLRASASEGGEFRHWHGTLSLKRKKMTFDGAGTTTGTDHLYLCTLGGTASGTENSQLLVNCKVNFIDD